MAESGEASLGRSSLACIGGSYLGFKFNASHWQQ
jgi:hypothetical protein